MLAGSTSCGEAQGALLEPGRGKVVRTSFALDEPAAADQSWSIRLSTGVATSDIASASAVLQHSSTACASPQLVPTTIIDVLVTNAEACVPLSLRRVCAPDRAGRAVALERRAHPSRHAGPRPGRRRLSRPGWRACLRRRTPRLVHWYSFDSRECTWAHLAAPRGARTPRLRSPGLARAHQGSPTDPPSSPVHPASRKGPKSTRLGASFCQPSWATCSVGTLLPRAPSILITRRSGSSSAAPAWRMASGMGRGFRLARST